MVSKVAIRSNICSVHLSNLMAMILLIEEILHLVNISLFTRFYTSQVVQDFFHHQHYVWKDKASNKPHEGVIFRIEIIHLEIYIFLQPYTAIAAYPSFWRIENLDSKQSEKKSQVPFSNILYSSMTPTFFWDATVSGRAWTMYNLPSSPSRAHSMSCNGSRNGGRFSTPPPNENNGNNSLYVVWSCSLWSC